MLLPSSAADRRQRCAKCGLLFKVPAFEEVPEAIDKIEDTYGTLFVDEKGNYYG